MLKKTTDDLLTELKSERNIARYLKENEPHFVDQRIGDYLDAFVAAKGLKKSQIFKDAEINEIYGYQIFSGTRKPSRNKLIALCISMGMSEEELGTALKYAGEAPLYARSKRDSMILSGILKGNSVMQINNLLYEHGEELL